VSATGLQIEFRKANPNLTDVPRPQTEPRGVFPRGRRDALRAIDHHHLCGLISAPTGPSWRLGMTASRRHRPYVATEPVAFSGLDAPVILVSRDFASRGLVVFLYPVHVAPARQVGARCRPSPSPTFDINHGRDGGRLEAGIGPRIGPEAANLNPRNEARGSELRVDKLSQRAGRATVRLAQANAAWSSSHCSVGRSSCSLSSAVVPTTPAPKA
jgi:hypothetical protein